MESVEAKNNPLSKLDRSDYDSEAEYKQALFHQDLKIMSGRIGDYHVYTFKPVNTLYGELDDGDVITRYKTPHDRYDGEIKKGDMFGVILTKDMIWEPFTYCSEKDFNQYVSQFSEDELSAPIKYYWGAK